MDKFGEVSEVNHPLLFAIDMVDDYLKLKAMLPDEVFAKGFDGSIVFDLFLIDLRQLSLAEIPHHFLT